MEVIRRNMDIHPLIMTVFFWGGGWGVGVGVNTDVSDKAMLDFFLIFQSRKREKAIQLLLNSRKSSVY